MDTFEIKEINFMPDIDIKAKQPKNIDFEPLYCPPERIAEMDEDLLWNI